MQVSKLLKKVLDELLPHEETKEFASEILANIEVYGAFMDKVPHNIPKDNYDEQVTLLLKEYPIVNREYIAFLWTLLSIYILRYPETLKELNDK